MKINLCCEKCKKEFITYESSKRIPGKFCSIKCRGKIGGRTKILGYEEKLMQLKKSFEKDVIRQENCWDWKGKLDRGYPMMSCSYEMGTNRGHKASYMIYHGPIAKGMSICHSCDNRKCTNPDHLWLGTAKENNNDMTNKGRRFKAVPPLKKGSDNAQSKLNEEKVKDIKKMLKENMNPREISEIYHVNQSCISKIKYNKTWKHVEV